MPFRLPLYGTTDWDSYRDSRIIYWSSRSLPQEEEHCCRPSSAYSLLIYFTDYTRFTALTTFCDGIYFRNIIWLLAVVYTLLTVACYQRWPRSRTAVNMTSVWKCYIVRYIQKGAFYCFPVGDLLWYFALSRINDSKILQGTRRVGIQRNGRTPFS